MRTLSEILAQAVPTFAQSELAHLEGVYVTGITSDSRNVTPGALFVAINGTASNGAQFVADAVRNGAAAVLAETPVHAPVPVIQVPDVRLALARLSALIYPRQPDCIAAITGTAGKTSVATFLRQIWELAGLQAAQIGTTGIISAHWSDYAGLTTPDPTFIHDALNRLAESGVSHVAMEASSHGLDQRRLDAVRLSAVAFTNLGRDHMDYHPDLDHYLNSKMRLFEKLAPRGVPAIVDPDAPFATEAAQRAHSAGLDVRTVGHSANFIRLENVRPQAEGQVLSLVFDGDTYEALLPLAGGFQVSNALVAAGLALSTGVTAQGAIESLSKLRGAPGRMERVTRTDEGAGIYVDYAHKPDSLRAVLACLRASTTGKLVVVFGCGGNRDVGKRPEMGRIAAELADIVIVTDDNPRFEDAAEIRGAVRAGAPFATEIADRMAALRYALSLIGPGDTLLVAGKGHETGQIVAGRTLPHSDRDAILSSLRSPLS